MESRSPFRSRTRSLPAAALLASLGAACTTHDYEPEPLDGDAVVAQLVAERAVDRSEPLTLDQAVELLRERGPAVREAIAAYETALALAEIPTPLSNPRLQVGPSLGFGSSVESNPVVPAFGASWSIPTGGRRDAADALRAARAEAARLEALAAFRDAYIDLREAFLETSLASARRRALAAIESETGQLLELARRSVDSGQSDARELAQLELELGRWKVERIGAEVELLERGARVAVLIGATREIELARDRGGVLPGREAVPSLAELTDGLARRHPDLLRLHAEYEVAERTLALAVERTAPDLNLGATATGEPGASITFVTLGLGVQVPLFDRGRLPVAAAERARAELRVAYENRVALVLAELERARERLVLALERERALLDEVGAATHRSYEATRRALAAGIVGPRELLDVGRAARELDLETNAAWEDVARAWLDLERASGEILAPFWSEPGAEAPPESLVAEGGAR